MTSTATVNNQSTTENEAVNEQSFANSWNKLLAKYNSLNESSIFAAFSRAMWGMANQPQIQNARIKAISTLPAEYTKEELGAMLTAPADNEKGLRQVASILRYSNYSTFKVIKSYADILTYKHYYQPSYIDGDTAKNDKFKREMRLVDEIDKTLRPADLGHKAAMQCGTQEKVFYILRSSIDKVHNKVNYLFEQQLPTEWCKIIGYNNISDYTISFDMMYFMQPGTDYTQYGDLFEPYMDDFLQVVEQTEAGTKRNPKYVYATKNSYEVHPERFNAAAYGSPKMFMQNGRWLYYVSLPVNRVWTYEIDDSSPIAVPFTSGLFQTFLQQSDYEAVQYALITAPLIKIFTAEIPYFNEELGKEDAYKMSPSGRDLYQYFFANLMQMHNTGGVVLYSAPFQNFKSHDFTEAANANETSSSFLEYGMDKTGLQALIPVNENPHQGISEYSAKLESRFADRIYRTLERMLNQFCIDLGLKYKWQWHFFGSIYRDDQTRTDLQKALDKGDITAYLKLAALDDMTLLDKLSVAHVVKASGFLDMLEIPPTAYTQSAKGQTSTTGKKVDNPEGGAPKKTEVDVQETAREKLIAGE